MPEEPHPELKILAEYLGDKKEAILEQWEREITEREVKSKDLLSISQSAFQNSIPAFIDNFCNSMLHQRQALSDVLGEMHGSQRWEYGLALQETMREWNVLELVLMDQIDAFHQEDTLSVASLKKAHRFLIEDINEGILFSVKKYAELQQKESEAQLRDLQQALKEPGDISRRHNLRRTSHDLKGIMKNIQMGFFLLEDEHIDPEAAEIIEKMSISADSLEQLLNDLLDLFRLEARHEEVELSEFDATKILSQLCESMHPMATSKDLELAYDGPESLIVKSDSQKVQRIARNLILNALKYTGEGYVKVKWKVQSDDQWLLEITDTGPGLSATHAESLTTKTETSSSVESEPLSSPANQQAPDEVQNHGEGIGLLIVRHLCKLLDANITIITAPQDGTTFKILFPRDLSGK
ncbi:sensor histidine kinase [Fodinibius sp.]|uniref:sensor histidine kinase n=1 Tax=Fodinibius sp. TaxID=1872440 RepID=UPI00356504E9